VQRKTSCRLLQEVQGLSDVLPNCDREECFESEDVYPEKTFSIQLKCCALESNLREKVS